MRIVRNSFSYKKDLDWVREFLLEIFTINKSLHYLIPIRIENQKHGPCGPRYSHGDDETIKIWKAETDVNSDVIAISHRGSAGNYHIEVHPDFKYMEQDLFHHIEKLEEEVIAGQKSHMYMYTVDSDPDREKVLTEMGYEIHDSPHEYNYTFHQDSKMPENPLPKGYEIRSLSGDEEYPQYIDLFSLINNHCRDFFTVERMKFLTEAQFYHQDLNLIVTDEEDKFVGFCMYRLDPLTRIAEIEALGTHPDHRNLGLEEALLTEGLKRLKKYQPILICAVEINVSDPMNRMLDVAGFTRTVTMDMWVKTLGK